jgi:hypothetical protein
VQEESFVVEDHIPDGEGDIDDLCMEIPVEIPLVNLEPAYTPSLGPQRCLKKKIKKKFTKANYTKLPWKLQ